MPIVIQPTEPVALVCAVTASAAAALDQAAAALEQRFGAVTRRCGPRPFAFTAYYEQEMGPDLVKQLLEFEERIDPADLPAVKRFTMAIEKQMARDSAAGPRRTANIDPGLVSVESLVLATTKYSGHRICIDPGLYAEVTLLFRRGACVPFEWTYPDYRAAEVQQFLLAVRDALLQARRRGGAAGQRGAPVS